MSRGWKLHWHPLLRVGGSICFTIIATTNNMTRPSSSRNHPSTPPRRGWGPMTVIARGYRAQTGRLRGGRGSSSPVPTEPESLPLRPFDCRHLHRICSIPARYRGSAFEASAGPLEVPPVVLRGEVDSRQALSPGRFLQVQLGFRTK